jgi:hypothetical protein
LHLNLGHVAHIAAVLLEGHRRQLHALPLLLRR